MFIFKNRDCISSQFKKPEDDISKAQEFEIIGSFEPAGGSFPKLKAKSPPLKYSDLIPTCSY